MAVASVPGRNDAVEKIHAALHRRDDVLRSPDSHEVARKIYRHLRDERLQHLHTLGLGLTDRKTPDGKSHPVALQEGFKRCAAQRRKHAALNDAEEPSG